MDKKKGHTPEYQKPNLSFCNQDYHIWPKDSTMICWPQLFIIKDTEAKNEGTLLFKSQDTEGVSWKDESNDVIQGQTNRLPEP
ncbi:MAG: hypothetical protein IKO40_00505, partial [Kiritimatiellae bacterium]|nr:hypothetical protein [Kiritimatiellia bacterium]